MITDMTKGRPFGILLTFALPLLLSMFFQQMYNMADSLIAGQFLGVHALAATGAAYPITVLFLAVATGASVGCSVVISQLFGARDYNRMKGAVNTAVVSLVVSALVLTVIGEVFSPWLLQAIDTPKDIFDMTVVYLRIYIAGLLFVFLYNTANAIFNGLGDSQTPLYFLAFSTTFNVILDIWFATGLHLGIVGLSIATLIAQGLASVLAIATLIRRVRRVPATGTVKLFDRQLFGRMSLIAVPSIFQQSFVSVGVFFVQGLVNHLGADTVAGFSVGLKISTFALMVMNAMPTALSSFAAQNIGAEDIKRVRQGWRDALILSEITICSIIVLFFLKGDTLLGLFISGSRDGTVVNIGLEYLLIVAPFYPLVGLKNCCDSVLRGGGAMRAFMVTTFADLLLRVILAYVLMPLMGFAGICYAYPLGWIIGTSLSVILYISGCWKPKHLDFHSEPEKKPEETTVREKKTAKVRHPRHHFRLPVHVHHHAS